ncbi:ras-related protein Rab-15-like isoform X2 [Cottoperca gobio]|uniref:Ras-related protein Rab-15 n=1 Tax=Cottoperca gobio TaxID=56716 RepID=A0A6J2S4T6_COTGO|nr:ras-related protein Rab-15-like isoform X2 [Cottoperca gobio]
MQVVCCLLVYEISFPRNPEGSNSTATWKSHAFLCVVVMAKQYDVLFRLLMLGDSGVGKTCMLRRFTESEFHPSHISTIGVDFKMKTLELDGLKVRVQIWDTAGQERYQTITKQYYRRAQGIIFVYDITNEPSFQHLVKWASDVDEYAPDKVQRILVGNKSDEELGRQVTKDQGSKLAETYGMEFFETSASTSSNISESFTRVTELVLQAHKRDEDNLLGSLDDYLENAALEEEIGSEGTDDNTKNTCAC